MAHCLGCFNFYSMEVPILALFYFRFWFCLCTKLGIGIIFTISELCWWMCTMYILCCSHVVLFCTLDDNFGHQHLMPSSPTRSIGVRFFTVNFPCIDLFALSQRWKKKWKLHTFWIVESCFTFLPLSSTFTGRQRFPPPPHLPLSAVSFQPQAAKNAKLQPGSNKSTKLHLRETSKKTPHTTFWRPKFKTTLFKADSHPNQQKITTLSSGANWLHHILWENEIKLQPGQKTQNLNCRCGSIRLHNLAAKWLKDKLQSPKWRSKTTELFVLP